MTISKKLLGSVIAILVAAFGVLGWIVNARARDALVAQASQSLEAVRLARGRLIEQDLRRTTGTVRLVADTIFVRQSFLQLPAAIGHPDRLEAARVLIDPLVRNFMSVFEWAGVLLILPDGTIGYSSGTTITAGVDVRTGPLATTGLGTAHARALTADAGAVEMFDFSEPQPVTGPPNAFLSVPVFDAQGRQRLGVLIVRLASAVIDEVVNDPSGLGTTGETYLVGPDRLMRSSSRTSSAPSIMRQRVDTETVRRALDGESGTVQQVDYRGVPVISSFAPLDMAGLQWVIVAEMDLAEILVPARALSQRIALLFGAFSLAAGVLLVVVLRKVVLEPVEELTASARRVQAGDFTQEARVESADELGQLGGAMNTMMRSVGDNVAALRSSRDYLERILNITPIGVGIAVDGILRFSNPHMHKMLGIEIGDVAALRYADPTTREYIVQGVREQGVIRDIQAQAIGRNGEVLDVLGTFCRIDYEGQQGILGWIVDVTTLKRAEQELERRYEQLQQLQTLRDNLTHMIVHDLRGPLSSVMGYLELLEIGGRFGGDDAECLGYARSGAQGMAEMITGLLDVTRLEAGEMPLDRQVGDLVTTAQEASASLSGLMLGRHVEQISDGAVAISYDHDLIRRVIANLLGNALKFTPPSGRIAVVVIRTETGGRVEVRDNGPGIEADALSHIFDKFAQAAAGKARKQYSSGLGLAFCKLAVEAHGGTIDVESSVGRGTTFWFELPAGV